MSALTPEQEARVREIVREEEAAARGIDLVNLDLARKLEAICLANTGRAASILAGAVGILEATGPKRSAPLSRLNPQQCRGQHA